MFFFFLFFFCLIKLMIANNFGSFFAPSLSMLSRVVFLKDVTHAALKDLIQFMYCGEVNVKQDALPTFISTAEALQIKGLTETGDTSAPPPPAAQTSHVPIKTVTSTPSSTSPRPRIHRPNVSRTAAYKIDSEDSSDDKQTIVVQQPQKRVLQRSIQQSTAPKRTKPNDPLEGSDIRTQPQQQQQQIITVTTTADDKSIGDAEFINIPMETIPTKSEPEYGDEVHEVEDAGDNEATYVEDDSYGDMKYDESYFTENDDGKGNVSTFGESYNEGDTSANEAQG